MGSLGTIDTKTLEMPETPPLPALPLPTETKRKVLQAGDIVESQGCFLSKQPTLQVQMPRPWYMDYRCVDVCVSFQCISRADLIRIGDDRENRQRLVKQLQEGKCSQAPLATMDLIHSCFETLVNMVACINNGPECISYEKPVDWDCSGCDQGKKKKKKCDIQECTRCGKRKCSVRMSDVDPSLCITCSRPSEKFGEASSVYGDVQWSKVRLPWVYVFSAFNTLIRLLCLPETRIRYDSLFIVLVACLFLALKTDEGIYSDTVNIPRFVDMTEGSFSGSQLREVVKTLWRALDFVAPNALDGLAQDDIITSIFVRGYKMDDDTKHNVISRLEKGVVESFFKRDTQQHLTSGAALSMSREIVLLQFDTFLEQTRFLCEVFKLGGIIE